MEGRTVQEEGALVDPRGEPNIHGQEALLLPIFSSELNIKRNAADVAFAEYGALVAKRQHMWLFSSSTSDSRFSSEILEIVPPRHLQNPRYVSPATFSCSHRFRDARRKEATSGTPAYYIFGHDRVCCRLGQSDGCIRGSLGCDEEVLENVPKASGSA